MVQLNLTLKNKIDASQNIFFLQLIRLSTINFIPGTIEIKMFKSAVKTILTPYKLFS